MFSFFLVWGGPGGILFDFISLKVLNAKPENVEREAEIVAQSGRLGAVTIATNMAGRGTDIILGGNAEFMARLKLREMLMPRYLLRPNLKQRNDINDMFLLVCMSSFGITHARGENYSHMLPSALYIVAIIFVHDLQLLDKHFINYFDVGITSFANL